LQPGDAEAGQQSIKSLLEKRSASQPTQLPSCGSVFRNPPGDHAARLIEASGLKGHCIGDACVSDKHANFIINNGQAKAAEVERLMGLVQQTVEERFGVRLRAEVHIVGERA
jgi:UDP-N-acetylmuramate dehydrogenase